MWPIHIHTYIDSNIIERTHTQAQAYQSTDRHSLCDMTIFPLIFNPPHIPYTNINRSMLLLFYIQYPSRRKQYERWRARFSNDVWYSNWFLIVLWSHKNFRLYIRWWFLCVILIASYHNCVRPLFRSQKGLNRSIYIASCIIYVCTYVRTYVERSVHNRHRGKPSRLIVVRVPNL